MGSRLEEVWFCDLCGEEASEDYNLHAVLTCPKNHMLCSRHRSYIPEMKNEHCRVCYEESKALC